MIAEDVAKPRPGHRTIRIAADGEPWIEAFRCDECRAILADAGMACRSCGSRDGLTPFRVNERGTVFSWAVIHRSYPGISVPFVSAVVDLEGGLTLKGTLRNIAPDDMRVGLPVELTFDRAGGAKDAQGPPYVGFHFLPAGACA